MRGFIPPQNREETVFVRQIASLCERSDRYGKAFFTHFLDLRQKELFISRTNGLRGISTGFCRGFEGDSERVMACVFPDYLQLCSIDFPLKMMCCTVDSGENLTHRDFLGACMGLMIKREQIGDIFIVDNVCYMACSAGMAPVIISELQNVGRAVVHFDYCHNKVVYKRTYSQVKDVTVSSFRADRVLSAVLNISRSKASNIISVGRLSVNHLLVNKKDFEIEDGDVLSIKGIGKFSVSYSGNRSRKDRYFITYHRY